MNFKVLQVISLLLQFVIFIGGDCSFFNDRNYKMQQKFVTFLKAVQLFQTELISSVVCASYCTAVAECYYMTVDTKNIVCTFYSQGSTYYNTTNLTTYVLVSTWVEFIDESCDVCSSIPCQNDAFCANMIEITPGYVCFCLDGFTGVLCETNINECVSLPCQNGGTCNDLVNGYQCSCVAGYTGILCETNINECASLPCLNGGTCGDLVNGFQCSCTPSYAGNICQTIVNPCASSPCYNGGTCSSVNNGASYLCACSAVGYAGLRCETDACNGYNTITDSWRSPTSYSSGNYACDGNLAAGWYRFILNGINANMISYAPSPCYCGSFGGIWWVGSVPQYVGQVIRGSGCGVCDSAGSSSCPPGNCGSPSTCDSQTPINDLYMKNCGSFNVYYLTPPPRCQFAYCMST